MKAGNDPTNQKAALLAYLHVDVLYFNYPNYHAESLYHLSKLWEQIGKRDRAKEAKDKLTTRYKGSSWANKP